jgi:ArsR family transcriptional regulator, virulence genes transcriptional regulator
MQSMFDLTRFDLAMFQDSAARAAGLLRTLANEKRLMVLCQLADGEMSVGQIQERVSLSQSALSQHLAVLRDSGVVATRRQAQTIYYRIADPAALRVIQTLAELFCPDAAAPQTGETK